MKKYIRKSLRKIVFLSQMPNVYFSFLLVLLMFMPVNPVQGEKGVIDDIRNQYDAVQKSIKTHECYLDQVLINKENYPYPGSGNYQATYDIYYKLGEISGGVPRHKCILMIQVKETVAVREVKQEYLFDINGKLIFYYVDDQTDDQERRYYFSGGLLVRYSLGDAVFDKDIDAHVDKKMVEGILKKSQYIRNFFEGL
jgi:hypothetical protein